LTFFIMMNRCLLAFLSLVSFFTIVGCGTSYQGQITTHFNGKVFSNPGQVKDSSVAGYLWLRLTTSQATWPDAVPLTQQAAPAARVNDGSARVTWIGHATLLIQVAGLNILTDPVWADRASPLSFLGPKRVTPAAIALKDLPKIDVVLLSHNHYDHLDTSTLSQIDVRDQPRVIVPLGNRALVSQAMPASRVTEHDWGDQVDLSNQTMIHVEPMVHGSGRTPFDQMQTLWAAYVIVADSLKIDLAPAQRTSHFSEEHQL
jgi:Beta-lactamase superfamily domain